MFTVLLVFCALFLSFTLLLYSSRLSVLFLFLLFLSRYLLMSFLMTDKNDGHLYDLDDNDWRPNMVKYGDDLDPQPLPADGACLLPWCLSNCGYGFR